MRRDFTYIDDIIEGVMRVMARIPQPDPAWDSAKPNPSTSTAPWRIYNIGNNNTVELGTFISTLEDALGKKAIRNLMPMQPATWKPHGPTCPTLSRTPASARRLP